VKRTLTIIYRSVWAIVFAFITSTGLASTASAYSLQEGVNAARGTNQPADLFGTGGVITSITSVLLFIVGALSIIMLIIGGLRYVVSGGSATAVTAAKNTILYAIVGLVIAFLAFAAINFVLTTLTPGTGGPGYTDV
jgi:hypothetical protein